MKGERAGNGSPVLYWSLQTLGWGGYFSIAAAQMYAASKRLTVLAVWLLIMLGHLAGSHVLRLVIRRSQWLSLPVLKLAVRLFLTVALLAISVDLCVSPVAIVAGTATFREQVSMYWLYVLATFILLSLWSFCYVAFVRYREKEHRALHLGIEPKRGRIARLEVSGQSSLSFQLPE